jgi:hypothetical protein
LWFDYGLMGCFCTFAGLYRSGVLVGCVGWGAGGGGVGGVVVPVVVRDGRRYPPLHLYSWNDKGVWNAEIFF